MKNSQELAITIKEIAKSKKIAIGQMLRDCDLSINTLSSMQAGGYYPRLEAISKIADYLGCSVDYLLGRSESKQTNADIKDIVDLSREEVMELLAPANQSTVVINIQNKGGENKAFEMDADDFSELMQLVELKKTMMRKNLDDK